MFTGIVSEVGTVSSIKEIQGGRELEIECTFAAKTHKDESIAVNGVCLTVVSFNETSFRVQCVGETLRKTGLGKLKEDSKVNLERSLTLDKGIEGHLVQGHVDTTGTITSIIQDGADLLVTIQYPDQFRDLIVGRGSIAIDGISLTVARNEDSRFTVAIIPYTWEHTNLKERAEGDSVNLEFDMFGKYIIQYLKNREKG